MTGDELRAVEEQCETRAVEPHLVRLLLAERDELREKLEAYKEATGIVEKVGYVDSLNAAIHKEAERGARLAAERDELRRLAGELARALGWVLPLVGFDPETTGEFIRERDATAAGEAALATWRAFEQRGEQK